jgi:CelD/BcsL family acetyltransferase involved in cellulose biosynthesis
MRVVSSKQTSLPHQIVFRREALPRFSELEREWGSLEAAGHPSFFTSWHWIGTLLAALPPASRPKLLRGTAHGQTVSLALLGANQTRRRRGLVRSRGLYLNETGDPRFDALTIEHNGILAAAEWELVVWDELIGWFAGLRAEADELHIGGSQRRLPEAALRNCRLECRETSLPSYSVDLIRLEDSDGELYPVLSSNARQQLRRALRYFERFGALRLAEAATIAEAITFFDAIKELHCASWERRGRPHSFCAGDRVIGYLYNFRLGDRVYAYQSGFDDADRRERPGIVTHFLAIRHAYRSGAGVYDFMAGRNRLKESFATRCEPMLWQTVQQPRLAFRLEDCARQFKRALTMRRSRGA